MRGDGGGQRGRSERFGHGQIFLPADIPGKKPWSMPRPHKFARHAPGFCLTA
jgi:hypothetical protein